jgi:hypothetical protein
MSSRFLQAAVAALSLVCAAAPAIDAHAQFRHAPGGFRPGGFRAGPGFRGGPEGYHRGFGPGPVIGALALGAALGYYAGHPYYCRHHHHWRWSPYYQRYVYVYDGYC